MAQKEGVQTSPRTLSFVKISHHGVVGMRAGLKSRRDGFDSCWWDCPETIFRNMKKLTRTQLRTLIEAEVDTVRLPKGPNSHDDAEDKPLKETDMVPEGLDVPELDRLFLKEETDPVYDVINQWSNRLSMIMGEIDDDLLQNKGKATDKTYIALDGLNDVLMTMNKFSKTRS